MKELLNKKTAQELFNKRTLLPVKRFGNDGFLLTDFSKVYHLSKEAAYDGENFNPEFIGAHNQVFVLYEVDEKIIMPFWFKKEFYEEVAGKLEIVLGVDGYCYTPEHNGYTGSSWYASNVKEAVRNCIFNLNPIWDIAIRPMTLVYDNGEMGYTKKAVQIWRQSGTYHLSFLHSRKEKKTNTENISDEAITLIMYATDNNNSKWREHKRWTKFLKFSDKIEAFEKVSLRKSYGITSSVTEEIEVAKAGDYILAKLSWGGLFGGEGDCGEDLYIFEDEDEMRECIDKLHNIKQQD